jgi:signal peptidase
MSKNDTLSNSVENEIAETAVQDGAVLNKAVDVEIEQTATQRVTELVSDILFYLLLVAILVAAIMFASSKTPGKSIFGYRYYDVLTGSMVPTYNVGDLIFVKVTDAADINVGDAATFNPGSTDDSYLTHRVTEKLENYEGTGVTCFRTKGDANDTEDPFIIDESRMIGVVKLRIPLLGYVVQFVQYHYIMVIVFIVLVSLFFSLLKKYMEVSAEVEALEKQEALEDATTEKDE